MESRKEELEYAKNFLGKWYSWDSPIGLGLGLISFSASFLLLVQAIEVLRRIIQM